MKPIAIVLSLFLCLSVQAQTERSWEQVWQELGNPEDMDESEWTDDYERMSQLADHPLDLNQAGRDDLEQLPFLSGQQVMDFLEYRDRYGPLRSMNELKMIRSMDYRQLTLLPFFTFVGAVAEEKPRFPRWQTIAKYGHHTVTATARIPFYKRRGDSNGYMGYPYRHSLRYEFSYGQYLKAGIVGAQDAGEPFFANRNGQGYDAYSYYLQVRRWGVIDNAIIGKYKVSAGMGLVLNTSFSLGKLSTLQNLGRQHSTLRVHSSRSESDYFQGAAATVRLARPLTLTAMASYRPMDATLNADGTAATLLTSGYHRTETEMEKKYNTHLSSFGGSLVYRQGGLYLGGAIIHTHLDRSLRPDTSALYRRHYAQGQNFFNAGIHYGYTQYRFSVNGETAVNADGALATINTVSYQPSSLFSLMALQRFYSYRYTALHAHSFGSQSKVQNESGFFMGFTWNPLSRLHLQGYADYAYFPWARYQVSQTSHAWDFLLQGDWQVGRWQVRARHRLQWRQKDNADASALVDERVHRSRLSVGYAAASGWGTTTQADYVHSGSEQRSQGVMVSQHLSYQQARWQAHLSAGFFSTDDYDSRIYVYERQLQHEFYFPMYYGRGVRLALTAQASLTRYLRLSAKFGYTRYSDRSVIGSGLQQIDGSSQSDLDVQLRWRL